MKSFLLQEQQAFLRYEDLSGESPAYVYLSGLGLAAHASFAAIVTEHPVLVTHRSVFVDLLGTGFSDGPEDFGYSLEEHAKTVAMLLDELDLRSCSVIGYSMGGAVAITLTAIRPDLVSRLVLMEANIDPGGGMVSRSIAEQTEEAFRSQGFQTLIETWRQEAIGGDAVSATAAGILQVAAPHALHRSAVSLVHGTRPTMRERLLQMTIPRAYIFGEQSLLDPEMRDIWDALASEGIQLLSVPSAAHGMVWDNPSGVAEAVDTALNA
jgi:pimeloyl-ACP methyl ester carboxylesterase